MKTVLVTGGSRGIGRCIAENLAKKGFNVVLNYNKSVKQAKEIKKELKDKGHNIEIFKADVSKREEVKKLVEFTLEKFKNIDVLINNAGIAKIQLFTDITDNDWNEMINTNLNSVFYVTQEVVTNMINNKSGLIINISSIWGQVGASCESSYSAAKAGIDGLTKSLAKELGPSNIRVNSIAPGAINTDINKKLFLDEEIKEQLIRETPLERIGRPIDIYRCVKWLIEDEFTTGQVISPNGGYVII